MHTCTAPHQSRPAHLTHFAHPKYESKKLESLDKVLSPDASITNMRPYLKDMKGLKINHPVVTVEFR